VAGNKSVRLFLLGDNRDARAKIDEVDVKADELSAKHPELKIGIDTAAAAERLAILREELKGVNREAEQGPSKLSVMGSALTRFATGGVASSFKELSLLQKGLIGVQALVAIGPAPVMILGTALGGLAAGGLAAGAGLGVFGLVAKTVFSESATAASTYVQAMNATGKARAALMKKFSQDTAGMSADQKRLTINMASFTQSWQGFANSNIKFINPVAEEALGALPDIFDRLQPFLAPTSKALVQIIDEIDKGASSAGFGRFVGDFAKASGPNLLNIAHSIGNIVAGLGDLLHAFLPVSTTMTGGLAKLTLRFREWADQQADVPTWMAKAKADWPKIAAAGKDLGATLKNIFSAVSSGSGIQSIKLLINFTPGLLMLLRVLSSHPQLVNLALWGFTAYKGLSLASTGFTMVKAGWTAASGIVSGIGMLAGKINLVSIATRLWAIAQAALNIVMSLNPIMLIIIGIGLLVAGFLLLWKHSAAFRNFWIGAWKDIVKVVMFAVDWVKHNWPLLLAILTGPIGLAVLFIVKHWDQITQGAKRMFNNVVGFFRSIPGAIMRFTQGFERLLWNAGSALIGGLLNGIISRFEAVKNFIGGIASWIAAHKGPIAYDAVLLRPHGQAIMKGLVGGLQDGMPGLSGQLARTTSAVASARMPAYAGGGGALKVEWVGGQADDEFMTWLKKNIRFRGGDPSVIGN
jgi:phage-related protein